MGLIGNTNSDLLNLLSGAAPSAQSSANAAGTSSIPATGSFRELLLHFPSTDVFAASQAMSAVAPMLPKTQSAVNPLITLTPSEPGSLRLFSQDGSLLTTNRSEQSPSMGLLSELERLEQAVAELQTVTLYVPPEAGLNLTGASTAPIEGPQLFNPNSESPFEQISSGGTPETIWSTAQGLQIFPQVATVNPATAADSRLNVDTASGKDSEATGIKHGIATQASVSTGLASTEDADSMLISAESRSRAVTTSAADSIPPSPAGNGVAVPEQTNTVLVAGDPAASSPQQSPSQQQQMESSPFARSADTGAADSLVGNVASATSTEKTGAQDVTETVLQKSRSFTADSAVQLSDRNRGVTVEAVRTDNSSPDQIPHQRLTAGIAGQPTSEAASVSPTASVSPLTDVQPQPAPVVNPTTAPAETTESSSGERSSESAAGLQEVAEKSERGTTNQGDGSDQRHRRGNVPPVPTAAVDAAAPASFSRAAAAAVPAAPQEPEVAVTRKNSETSSATASPAGLTSFVSAVTPGVATPVLNGMPNAVEIAEQLATEVSRRVETSVVNGQERFTMRLDPPELGELVISMRRTADGIELHVDAADPATMNLIQNGIDQLKGDSERAGSIFQQLNIDVTTSGQGSGHTSDQRRSATPSETSDRIAENVSDSSSISPDSDQISFVA